MPTLLIDGTTTPYANLATATAAISDQAAIGCYAEGMATSTALTRGTLNSSFSGGTFTESTTMNLVDSSGTTPQDAVAARIYLTVSGGFSCSYNLTASTNGGGSPVAGNFFVALYADDQTSTIASTGFPSATPISGILTATIPSDGYYWLYAIASETWDTPGTGSASISLTSTGTGISPCKVRAAYGATPNYVLCV